MVSSSHDTPRQEKVLCGGFRASLLPTACLLLHALAVASADVAKPTVNSGASRAPGASKGALRTPQRSKQANATRATPPTTLATRVERSGIPTARPSFSRRTLASTAQNKALHDGIVLMSLFLNYLKCCTPSYRNFATIVEKSGFNNTLAGILSGYQVTILVPRNSELAPQNTYSTNYKQRLGFHVLYGYWDKKSLSSALPGSKFPTAQTYPKTSSIFAYRVRTNQFQLNGRASDGSGAALFSPNIFTDGKKRLIAHGVTAFMKPPLYL